MSAVVPKSSPLRQLDRRAEPDEQFSSEDAKLPDRLSRVLMRILRDVSTLKRRFSPDHVDFEDIAVDATGVTQYRFPHRMNGRVRWWVVDRTVGTAAPSLLQHSSTDANTLVLVSSVACTVTLRVEVAG